MTVVDNASPDDSLGRDRRPPVDARCAPSATAASPPAATSARRAAAPPYVLLLNPDARDRAPSDLDALVAVLDADPARRARRARASSRTTAAWRSACAGSRAGARPSPRRCSCTVLWPRAAWTDELVRDPAAYEQPGSPEWVSGACMLVRRSALERGRRARRGLLPVLRGHRPLRPAARRGLGHPLRAGARPCTTRAAPRAPARSCLACWPATASSTPASTAAASPPRSRRVGVALGHADPRARVAPRARASAAATCTRSALRCARVRPRGRGASHVRDRRSVPHRRRPQRRRCPSTCCAG